MSLKHDYFGKSLKLDGGPGGWRCSCCNRYGCSPRKMKARARRLVRRVDKLALRQAADN